MTSVDRARHEQGHERAVAQSMPAPHEQHDSGDDPTRPARHRGVGPSGVVDHGARQLEHGATEGGPEAPHPEDAAQGVRACARDQEPRQHDDRERIVDGEEVAQCRRDAEDTRLPVEREGHAEDVVGVPQRELAAVDLVPRQVRPRDELLDLVRLDGVVHRDPGLAGQPETGQQIEGAQRRSRMQRPHQNDRGRQHGPCHAECVGGPSATDRGGSRRPPGLHDRWRFRLVPLFPGQHVRSLRAAPDARRRLRPVRDRHRRATSRSGGTGPVRRCLPPRLRPPRRCRRTVVGDAVASTWAGPRCPAPRAPLARLRAWIRRWRGRRGRR